MHTNMDQLRHAIDSGELGDKISVIDPAAAPLGTDEEAAGTPPTQRHIDHALAQPRPAPAAPRRGMRLVWMLAALAGLAAWAII